MRLVVVGFGVWFATGCVTDGLPADDGVSGGGKADGSSTGLAAKYGLALTSTMNLEDARETDPAKRFTTITLRARGLVATKAAGSAATLSVKLCDITLPVVSGHQPQLDPAFVTALPALAVTGTITADKLVTDPAALILGASLADPLKSPVPQLATSPDVVDQDHDGNPGVSIQVPGFGKIYSAIRVKLELSVPLNGATTLAGTATIGLDQAIYGDDILFYDAAASFAQSQQYVKLTSATNTVKLREGESTCAAVAAAFP